MFSFNIWNIKYLKLKYCIDSLKQKCYTLKKNRYFTKNGNMSSIRYTFCRLKMSL